MTDDLFTLLYDAMTGSIGLAMLASFAWGILSILLSPCHLSSIPLIVGFIGAQGKTSASRPFAISLIFSLGILITIGAIGLVTASLGRMMGDIGNFGTTIVAAVFFIVGLYLLDVLQLDWNTIGIKKTKVSGLAAAFVLGLLFGLAVGPCTFAYMAPVLGIVFETAQTRYALALLLLSAFAVGHCSVIVGAGTLAGNVQSYLDWTDRSKALLWIKRTCGVLVILGGMYLLVN